MTATSKLCLESLPDDGPLHALERPYAQMLPLQRGRVPRMSITVDAAKATELNVELRISSKVDNHTPDVILNSLRFDLPAGDNQRIELDFNQLIDDGRFAFVCVMENPAIRLHLSQMRITGLLALQYQRTQTPPQDIGVESFEFWTPPRRPDGHNIAMTFNPPINGFDAQNICNGVARPTSQANAWVADPQDPAPQLDIQWVVPQSVSKLTLMFDTDFDHAMETTLRGHPEAVMPFAVEHYRIKDGAGAVLAEVRDNHQTVNTFDFDPPVEIDQLQLEIVNGQGDIPAAVFAVHCYQ